MGDQYEPIVFGGDPPPPPKTPQASDPFDDNHYEIPTFGNNKNKVPPPPPPPPAGKEKSIASDSLASHKGRLSYQDKHGGKNKKQKLNASAIKNYKKNKTKGSMQQDDLKSDVKSPNDPTGGDPFEEGGENNNNKKGRATKSFEKKSGGKSKSGVISVSNKPSAEGGTKTSAEVRSSMAATGTDGKPKRKKTAQ
uniref:Uncharacterized protein n=1 Tax=Panagrolaimus sp. ES5 TaxID=591445 RepID=A0AC34G4Q7_9BILA